MIHKYLMGYGSVNSIFLALGGTSTLSVDQNDIYFLWNKKGEYYICECRILVCQNKSQNLNCIPRLKGASCWANLGANFSCAATLLADPF